MNAQSGKAMGGICRNALEWSIFSLGNMQAKRITELPMLASFHQSLTHVVLCELLYIKAVCQNFIVTLLFVFSFGGQCHWSGWAFHPSDGHWCQHSWCRDMLSLSLQVTDLKTQCKCPRSKMRRACAQDDTKQAICTSPVPTTLSLLSTQALRSRRFLRAHHVLRCKIRSLAR